MSKYQKDNDSDVSDKNGSVNNDNKAKRGKRGGVKQRLREMQAKVRELEAQAHGRSYSGYSEGGTSGYYNDTAYPSSRPQGKPDYCEGYSSAGAPSSEHSATPYYSHDYYYGNSSAAQPPSRYSYTNYDYPRPTGSAAVNRTPGYPAGYTGGPPEPASRRGPRQTHPASHQYEGFSPSDPDIQWLPSSNGKRKQPQAATGGNTVPLGPPRGTAQPG